MFDFTTIMGVDMFTFLVGPNKTPIKVHANLFEGLSDSLHVLINGKMSEAQNKICELPSLELDVFLGIVQFAYQEDYTKAAFASLSNKCIEHSEFEPQFTEQEFKSQFSGDDWVKSPAWKRFEELEKTLPPQNTVFAKKWRVRCGQVKAYFYAAKLASAANCYLFLALEDHVLGLLYWSLRNSALGKGITLLLFLLLRSEGLQVNTSPRLHEMVMLFFAGTGQTWINCKAYLSLLEENPDITLELLLLSTGAEAKSTIKREREESAVDGPNKIAKT